VLPLQLSVIFLIYFLLINRYYQEKQVQCIIANWHFETWN